MQSSAGSTNWHSFQSSPSVTLSTANGGVSVLLSVITTLTGQLFHRDDREGAVGALALVVGSGAPLLAHHAWLILHALRRACLNVFFRLVLVQLYSGYVICHTKIYSTN